MREDWGQQTMFVPIRGRWSVLLRSGSSLGRYRVVTWFWRSSGDWSEILEGNSNPIGADLTSLGSWPPDRCMVDGSRWKSILGAVQRGSAKEVLCLRPWSQDGWLSFRLAIYLFTILTYRSLLTHWALRVHYNISFLSPCSHFCTGMRVL